MQDIFGSLISAISVTNIAWMLLGTLLGVIVGALPGLSAAVGISLLIPLSYGMNTVTALILCGGIYVGAVYGGSITAILLGVPGDPASGATVIDGYVLTESGKSLNALGASTTASALGGIAGAICLMFFTPLVVKIVIRFGAPEQFMMAMFGLAIIAAAAKGALIKGIIAGLFGLLIGTIGYDPITGYGRFTFGTLVLDDGLELVSVIIGMFGFAQVLTLTEEARTISKTGKLEGKITDGVKSVFKSFTIIPSTLIGLFVGALPGTGGATANFLAYTFAARTSKDGDTFGEGNIKGVIAPEASNNATVGTSLIPTLAFGIPGSAPAAIVLGLLTLHGVPTGTRLFVEMSGDIYTFFWGLLFANICLLLCLPLLKQFANVCKAPHQLLIPSVLLLCVLGSYSLNQSMFDVVVSVAMGLLAYFMKKAGYPAVCLLLGLVLGEMAEQNLFRSLLMYDNMSFVFTRPICLVIFILIVAVIGLPVIKSIRIKKK